MNKKFSITFVLEVDEDNNILSSLDEAHVDDVFPSHDLGVTFHCSIPRLLNRHHSMYS